MILRTLLLVTFLRALHCHPTQEYVLPELDVSLPEEVNSLEQDEPIGRAIDNNPKNTIEETLREVEEIIKNNPGLPRLTRGEILDLIENITTIDEQKAKIVGKNRDGKAIMVVMPYTPNSDYKNMEDLYTKAPVTHIIGAEPFKVQEDTDDKQKHSRRRPPVNYNEDNNELGKKPSEEKKKYSASINSRTTSTVSSRLPEVTTVKIETIPTTYRPPTTISTTYRPKTRRPIRRRTTTVPTTIGTTTKHPNHRYPEDFVPVDGIRIIESPKLALPHFSDDLDLEENSKQEFVMKQQFPVAPVYIATTPKVSATVTRIPTTSSTTTTTTTTTPKPKRKIVTTTAVPKRTRTSTVTKQRISTTKNTTPIPLIEEINFPANLQSVVKDMKLATALDAKPPKPTTDEEIKIKNMLASIGILPETTTTTTTTLMPNAESLADSLSPEMRDLLMSFGLLPNPTEKPVNANLPKYYPEKAEIKPESYVNFKPLPDDGPSRDDMEALLASFGLGRSARRGKAMKKKPTSYSTDMIPDYLKGVIKDMGLTQLNHEERKIQSQPLDQPIFNSETQHANHEELKKLEKLFGTIKQIEKMNGTATEEELKHIDLDGLRELIGSLNIHNESLVTLDEKKNSPNPNNFDLGLNKNEVKRQESTTTSTTTTEEAKSPSLSDLEASFGGQTETVTEPPIPETTRKTGFYYLVDWNTFLDIDDTKGKRVNLRFQPTIGDPKRFLSVSVP